MDFKLQEDFLLVPLWSSEVILGSFVWVYMDVKRNSLCDILKVGEPRQPGDRAVQEPPIFILFNSTSSNINIYYSCNFKLSNYFLLSLLFNCINV